MIAFVKRSSEQNEALSMPISVAALFKQRVARPGQGRSGGYRTIIVWRIRQGCIFVHDFAKSGKADLTPDELEVYRKFAALLLRYDDEALEKAVAGKELVEVMCDA
jgi:hypothetical protein